MPDCSNCMKGKHIIIAVLMLLVAAGAFVARGAETGDDYKRLSEKAARYFENREWPNAKAMYTLMLDARPRVTGTYAHAIVADYMQADTVAAMGMLASAMDHAVPFDSLLADVQRVSMAAGSGTLYEDMLLRSRQQYPWMARTIDGSLLRYYNFRDNGPMIIRYAKVMLAGMPENTEFETLLARGYMLDGQPDQAAAVWQGLIARDPDNRNAFLNLANYFESIGRPAEARPFFERAQQLHPTPYVAARLAARR